MAKRHLTLYFLEVENLYLEMLENLKDFKELAQEGKIPQEDYDQALKEVDLLRANYERIAYIMMLLNKPNRKSNEEADMNKSWYASLEHASKEAILDESQDVLKTLKELIKKGRENNE